MAPILLANPWRWHPTYQFFFWTPPPDPAVTCLDAEARLIYEILYHLLLPYQRASCDGCHLTAIVRLLKLLGLSIMGDCTYGLSTRQVVEMAFPYLRSRRSIT